MSPAPPLLRFAWWNVQSFAHFDPNRVREERWPQSRAEYDAKCARVDAALRELIEQHPPDVLGLCEITEQAAKDLRQRLFPNFRLVFPTSAESFQVAVFTRDRFGFRESHSLRPERVPRTNREMPVVDYRGVSDHIRLIFCHWTAYGESSQTYRDRAAEAVTERVYKFLREPGEAKLARHAVVIGDLNEEPFGDLFGERLFASRDRARAVQQRHWTDADVRRIRLYNPTWRLLGERHPQGTPAAHCAGTYYHADGRSWHTYDQILVSGSLATGAAPFLDEAALEIMVLPGCLGTGGVPEKFAWREDKPTGLSDHLPLVGQIVLPPE